MNLTQKIKTFFAVVLLTSGLITAQSEQPNILFILCDDLGYADVGFNGSKDIITPHMDELAANGMIFTSAYAAHSFCGPSRASILTGRYSQEIGTPFNLHSNSSMNDDDNMGIPTEETFMSNILQDAGYYTSALGKWHLGSAPKYHPNNRGFDNYYGFLGGGHNYFPERYQKEYQKQLKAGNKEIRDYILPLEHNQKEVKETEYITDALSREAIKDIKKAADKKDPFFIYLAYNAPHVPLEAKDEDLKVFANIKNKDRRTYAAMVYAVDRGVGEIVKTLKETNQYNNTLIVFMSDNGGNFDHGANNYPLKGTKGDAWEGGYRVPMFFHYPNKLPKGKKFDYPVSALDLYPTFVNLGKGEIPKNKLLSGKDIMESLINNSEPHKNNMIYCLRYRHGFSDVGARLGDWKITRVGNEPWRLTNITQDIGEKKNMGGRYPDRLKKMVEETQKWTEGFVQPLWYYSAKDEELWKDGRMPQYNETFEVSKLIDLPTKH
ncbi:sulfatase-like hydrolase/transferase [Lutibacter sp. A64]|uniref:sulfatase-like hydrolase/transferase n=1 Tax=Lutibacter sp. A64 TaxID=2918526 RepID=UPI001F061C42|nr:sulfatase-like hydrolase/transferase [Lutibacter sp. A64]UMB54069.1 sulfatase-like hydrolase/transferase [Lutibacter sp. A64]